MPAREAEAARLLGAKRRRLSSHHLNIAVPLCVLGGDGENAIKDLKRACFADRLSDHRFWANQFRLLLHAAAYWLLDTVRRWLVAMHVERLQLDTLRLRLLKVGGRVYQWRDRVRLRLASSHPGQPLWDCLAAYHRLHE